MYVQTKQIIHHHFNSAKNLKADIMSDIWLTQKINCYEVGRTLIYCVGYVRLEYNLLENEVFFLDQAFKICCRTVDKTTKLKNLLIY